MSLNFKTIYSDDSYLTENVKFQNMKKILRNDKTCAESGLAADLIKVHTRNTYLKIIYL